MFPHLKRDLLLQQSLHDTSGVGMDPVQNGNVLRFYALPDPFFDLIRHILPLFLRIFQFLYMKTCPRRAIGFDLFFKTDLIVTDHTQCISHDVGCGPVIHIQKYLICLRIILLEAEH